MTPTRIGRCTPLGLAVVAFYSALCAAVFLLFGVPAMLVASMTPEAAALSLFVSGLGVVAATIAYGIWTRESWGLKLAIVANVVMIPASFVVFLRSTSAADAVMSLADVAIAVAIVAYLSTPSTKTLFSMAAPSACR